MTTCKCSSRANPQLWKTPFPSDQVAHEDWCPARNTVKIDAAGNRIEERVITCAEDLRVGDWLWNHNKSYTIIQITAIQFDEIAIARHDFTGKQRPPLLNLFKDFEETFLKHTHPYNLITSPPWAL